MRGPVLEWIPDQVAVLQPWRRRLPFHARMVPGSGAGHGCSNVEKPPGSPKTVCSEPRQPGSPASAALPVQRPGSHPAPTAPSACPLTAPVEARHSLLPASPQTQPHRIIQHLDRQIIMTIRRPDHNRRRLNPTPHQLANDPKPPPTTPPPPPKKVKKKEQTSSPSPPPSPSQPPTSPSTSSSAPPPPSSPTPRAPSS